MYNPTATNPFNVIKDMDTMIAELALSAIGGSAIFQAAFEIARAIDLESREALEAHFGAEKTNDSRNEEDAFEAGNDASQDVRESQGHEAVPMTAADHRRCAKNLIDIHTYCCEEVRAGNKDAFAQPQSMVGAIVFLCRGEPRQLRGTKGQKVEELIEKGVLSRERVQQAAAASAERTASSWLEVGKKVMAEYQALQGTTISHDDQGQSGNSAETLGEHAFNQLPATMGDALWDKFLTSFVSKFENFTLRVVNGFERRVSFAEIDKMVIFFNDAREACMKARRLYYKAHRHQLGEDAGIGVMEAAKPGAAPPQGGVAQRAATAVAAVTEKAATPAEAMEADLLKMQARSLPKAELPIL